MNCEVNCVVVLSVIFVAVWTVVVLSALVVCDASTTSTPAMNLQRQSAFLNNTGTISSSIILPTLLINLRTRLQFSFRTCRSGHLVYQESGNGQNSILVELNDAGRVNLMFRSASVTDQVSMTVDMNLANNQWYSVDSEFLNGNIFLTIEQGAQVIERLLVSNSTFRSYLWTLDLSESSGVVIGTNFTGCIHQGIGLNLDAPDAQVIGSVQWDACQDSLQFSSCGKILLKDNVQAHSPILSVFPHLKLYLLLFDFSDLLFLR